jgi:hypothetical protein
VETIKKWLSPAILVVLVPIIVVVAMGMQDFKTDYKLHKKDYCEHKEFEKENDKKMIASIEKLTTAIDSLRYELKFINFKNELNYGKRIE